MKPAAVVAFAIKAEIDHPQARTFAFTAQKTMYGGKHVAAGDTIFLFASENEGEQGLVARRRHVGESSREETGPRPADAAREHCRQANRIREAAARAQRVETIQRLE